MTGQRSRFVRMVLALALGAACESPTSRNDADVPLQPAAPEPKAGPEPTKPQPDKPLLDRVYDLAIELGQGLTTERIESSLDVSLTGTGPVISGTSRRWPMVVSFAPAKADEGASLGISFSDITTITLADIERRFGPPVRQVAAKESRSVYSTPSGARLRVKSLGGIGPKSLVGTMQLEAISKREPNLPDLFDG